MLLQCFDVVTHMVDALRQSEALIVFAAGDTVGSTISGLDGWRRNDRGIIEILVVVETRVLVGVTAGGLFARMIRLVVGAHGLSYA